MDLPKPESGWQKHTPLPNKILALLFIAAGCALPIVVTLYFSGWFGVKVLIIVFFTVSASVIFFKLADSILARR